MTEKVRYGEVTFNPRTAMRRVRANRCVLEPCKKSREGFGVLCPEHRHSLGKVHFPWPDSVMNVKGTAWHPDWPPLPELKPRHETASIRHREVGMSLKEQITKMGYEAKQKNGTLEVSLDNGGYAAPTVLVSLPKKTAGVLDALAESHTPWGLIWSSEEVDKYVAITSMGTQGKGDHQINVEVTVNTAVGMELVDMIVEKLVPPKKLSPQMAVAGLDTMSKIAEFLLGKVENSKDARWTLDRFFAAKQFNWPKNGAAILKAVNTVELELDATELKEFNDKITTAAGWLNEKVKESKKDQPKTEPLKPFNKRVIAKLASKQPKTKKGAPVGTLKFPKPKGKGKKAGRK